MQFLSLLYLQMLRYLVSSLFCCDMSQRVSALCWCIQCRDEAQVLLGSCGYPHEPQLFIFPLLNEDCYMLLVCSPSFARCELMLHSCFCLFQYGITISVEFWMFQVLFFSFAFTPDILGRITGEEVWLNSFSKEEMCVVYLWVLYM